MAFLLEPQRDALLMMPTDSPGRTRRVMRVGPASEDRALYFSIIAICIGASLGALLRWWLAIRLNELFPSLPLGTLTANLAGGYAIGVAASYLAGHPGLPPHWRLFVITGFLGGLTTFSTFSAEVALHLVEGRLAWSMATVASHVLGSVAMTLLGMWTVSLVRASQLSGG